MTYDCIIVGAGPAGSVCAYLLTRVGKKCLILERRPEIGEKICGGYLPNKAREFLLGIGIDIAKIADKDAVRVRSCMTIKGDKEYCFTYAEEDFGLGAYRRTLDQMLLDYALDQGAEIHFSTDVREVCKTKDGVMVEGYSAKAVVFATGACGHSKINVFQKEQKEKQRLKQTFGISEIIRGISILPEDRVFFWYEDETTMDYFWAIPISQDTWNIGLWCQKPCHDMKKRFYELRGKYIGANFTSYETLREPIGAFCGNVNYLPFMQIPCFGAGDFCGTNCYESGEGLYYALKSAKKSAEEVIKSSSMSIGQWPQGWHGEVLPIEWEILRIEDEKLLLLSKFGLHSMAYDEKGGKVYWESSKVRSWLCKEFMSAFSEEEKQEICEVTVENVKGSTKPDPEYFHTKEKVFLLSEDEVKVFGKNKLAWRRKATPWAKRNGAYADKKGNGVWWLRSYGRIEKLSMCVVRADGGLYPGADVRAEDVMVCPAMYIKW